MVGRETGQAQLFASVLLESKIPVDHPLRKLRLLVDECLKPWVSAWESRYSDVGQPGIPPAQLIRAQLLMAFYSIKSERSLCEHIETLIKAWASMKSFKADDASEDDKPNFKGTKRSNKTHSSRTDADARLFRKGNGQESMLCHMGHILVDSVTGLIRACRVTHATGVAEVEAALSMATEHLNPNQILVGDRLYDQQKFMDGARDLGVRAHPRAKSKGSRLTGQTTKSESYEASMKTRYIVERSFGWIKGVGRMRQTMLRGTEKVGWQFTLTASAMNLVRIANLTG